MTKLRNKLVLVLLALCLVVFAVVLTACGGDKKSSGGTANYVVTVKADDAAVSDVKVTVKNGKTTIDNKKTGSDGKATFKLPKSNSYTVTLSDLPDGFEVPADAALSFGDGYALTVNLAETFSYKVKLVKENGDPFYAENVTVGICYATNGNCLTPVAIDQNGLARIEAAKDDYHIQILGLPLEYGYEADENGYSMHQNEYGSYYWGDDEDDLYNSLSETVTEQTITIYNVNALDFDAMTELSDEQIAEYAAMDFNIRGGSAYKVSATVPEGATVYYSFTSDYNGDYTLYIPDPNWFTPYSVFVNGSFLLGENGGWVSTKYGYSIETIKGNTYYINITNNDEDACEVDFVLATPGATSITAYGEGEYSVTVYNDKASAVIDFSPAAVGAVYKATVQGDASAAIGYYWDGNAAADMWSGLSSSDFKTGSNCSVKFTSDMIGYSVYFGITVKADSYPATVKVKIEKTNTLTDTYNKKTTQDTLTQYTVPEDKDLVPLELDGTVTEANLVLDGNGYYHIGSVTGPIVVVNLTGNLNVSRFSLGGKLVYLELTSDGRVAPYVVDVTTDEDRASLTKGNTYDDYRFILRGFDDYVYSEAGNASIPTNLTGEFYAKYVNADGVYPLTAELKDILKAMTAWIIDYEERTNNTVLPNAEDALLWMFACYYYDEYMEPDVIAGEYKFVKYATSWETTLVGDEVEGWDWENDMPMSRIITEDEYKLVVDKRGSYVIYKLEDGDYNVEYNGAGVWSKSDPDGAYTFKVPDGKVSYADEYPWDATYEDLIYIVIFDAEHGRLVLINEDEEDYAVYVFQKGVEDVTLVMAFENEGGQVMLQIYDDDTFMLYIDDAYVASGTHEANGDDAIDITVTEGTATITYEDGVYSIIVEDNNYTIDTNGYPEEPDEEGPFTLFTDDFNAKLEQYEDGTIKFYIFVLSDLEWKLMAHCEIGGDGVETVEILNYIEKDESVVSVEITVENEAINVRVTYTDDTITYVFGL